MSLFARPHYTSVATQFLVELKQKKPQLEAGQQVGRALRALHGYEVAAQTLGVVSARWKLRIFVISAVFAATAGALTAHYAGFITPAKASFLHSVELVIMVVFGGMASIWGAVIGAAVLTLLPQLLTVLKDYEMMVFGAVLVATMVFFPRGIVPTLARLVAKD
mgnify:CR=1 FL=1